MLLLSLILVLVTVVTGAASAQSDIEKFMLEFDGEYGRMQEFGIDGPFDSKNPYVKPVKQLVTSENDIIVMLDKVLVTENSMTAAFLIGGELPENLDDVQLEISLFDVGPLLPYPEDSFELMRGGGGGGGPQLLIANEDPLILYHIASTPLMFYEGYVSPADPMQVKIRVPLVSIGWRYQDDSLDYEPTDYFYEELNHTFEFETDGAELAALTKNFDLDYPFEAGSHGYSFDNLRFNPMHLILFATDKAEEVSFMKETPEDLQFVKAVTDDKTEIILYENRYPYYGFSYKIINPTVIQSLEKTQTLTLVPCFLKKPLAEYEEYPQYSNPSDYDCNLDRAIVVALD
jgi:hypothetical protein